MSERVADITARIDNVAQLDAVVTAMRGIAATRAQQSRNLLAGIEAYAGTIADAIGRALAHLEAPPASARSGGGGAALILFAAEQGFAGVYNDLVLSAAGAEAAHAHLMIVGTRGAAIAAERGLAARWTTAQATQVGAVPAVANRLADALYGEIVSGRIARADVIHPAVDADRRLQVRRVALFPLDLEGFRRERAQPPPRLTLALDTLIERLVAEYIFARLSEAAMHAFAAENQARMEAMSAAGANIDRALAELRRRQNQVRQEEVTAEIVELAEGAMR